VNRPKITKKEKFRLTTENKLNYTTCECKYHLYGKWDHPKDTFKPGSKGSSKFIIGPCISAGIGYCDDL
jgi:hypothetical protein